MEVIRIRNGRRPGQVLIPAAKLGIGLVLCVAAAIGTWRGAPGGSLATAWLLGLLAMGFGLFEGRRTLDPRVKLTLSREGIRDHRSGGVQIPWSSVRRVRNLGIGNTANILELDLREAIHVGLDRLTGAGNRGSGLEVVRIPLEELDTSAVELMAQIRKLAPDVIR